MAAFRRLTLATARRLPRGELVERVQAELDYWHRRMDRGQMRDADEDAYQVFLHIMRSGVDPGGALAATRRLITTGTDGYLEQPAPIPWHPSEGIRHREGPVHYFAGTVRGRDGRLQGVCYCGRTTTPRTTRQRAEQALYDDHGWTTRATCAACGQEYGGSSKPWQTVTDHVHALDDPGSDRSAWACNDVAGCERHIRIRKSLEVKTPIPDPDPTFDQLATWLASTPTTSTSPQETP